MTEWFYHVICFAKVSLLLLKSCNYWDYCWKCEFDTDVKIGNYYHDGKELGFYEKVHIKTQSWKKDVLVIFILQEMKNSNLFDKNCNQENVKYTIFNMKKIDLHES